MRDNSPNFERTSSLSQVISGTLGLNGTWSSPLIIEADVIKLCPEDCGQKTVMVVKPECTGEVRRVIANLVAEKNSGTWEIFGGFW